MSVWISVFLNYEVLVWWIPSRISPGWRGGWRKWRIPNESRRRAGESGARSVLTANAVESRGIERRRSPDGPKKSILQWPFGGCLSALVVLLAHGKRGMGPK